MQHSAAIRIQKYLADHGVASRRHCEKLMSAGRVTVNGQPVTELGRRLRPGVDVVAVDGRHLASGHRATRTLMLNKPRGYECSTVPSRPGVQTVYALLKGVNERVVPAGRLDADSEGLLLLSNDGDLIQRITHPRHGHTKTYAVVIRGRVSAPQLRILREPMILDGYTLAPVAVTACGIDSAGGGQVLRFVLKEGRNRQIRRMCATAGLVVLVLRRVAIQGLSLGSLPLGKWRDLTPAEQRYLLAPLEV